MTAYKSTQIICPAITPLTNLRWCLLLIDSSSSFWLWPDYSITHHGLCPWVYFILPLTFPLLTQSIFPFVKKPNDIILALRLAALSVCCFSSNIWSFRSSATEFLTPKWLVFIPLGSRFVFRVRKFYFHFSCHHLIVISFSYSWWFSQVFPFFLW